MSISNTDKVLVIEDNPDTQILLKHLLASRYTLDIVSTVEGALNCIEQQKYAFLLVDINLGEARTGVDLLNIIRQNDLYAQTPMIAITAYALPGDHEKFLRLGFNDYVSKPFTRNELYEAIDQVISQTSSSLN